MQLGLEYNLGGLPEAESFFPVRRGGLPLHTGLQSLIAHLCPHKGVGCPICPVQVPCLQLLRGEDLYTVSAIACGRHINKLKCAWACYQDRPSQRSTWLDQPWPALGALS